MKRILGEVHRRSLWQVLGIYLGASWLVLQVVDTLAGALSLPDWSASLALFLLIIGLPIVLATAFVQGGAGRRAAPQTGSPQPGAAEASAPVAEPAPAVTEEPVPAHHGLFTWRNAVVGGVGAFALVGLLSAGWLLSRTLGIGPAATLQARGVLEDRALVVLADFESSDPEVASAATEALRVDLSQSDAIQLADPSLVDDALARMQRDPSEPLTAELAREIARREGAGAVLQGQISRAGDGYVFSAQLVSAVDGTTLTSQRETASGPDQVIGAIEGLSKTLRERIGESLGSIRESAPLARVTTSSLDALTLFSRSRDADLATEIELLGQALELDPDFAMAWRSLAILYRNLQTEPAKFIQALRRAFELRDHLTERERHLVAGDYYTLVELDRARAIPEFEAVLLQDPEDVGAITNIGVLYSELGDRDASLEWALRAVDADPESFTGYWNAITSYVNLGRLDEAQELVDSALVRFADRPGPPFYASTMIDQARGRLGDAEAKFLRIGELSGPRADVAGNLAALQAAQGRLAAAESQSDVGLAIQEETGNGSEYLEATVQAAWVDIVVRERPAAGRARLEAALEKYPLDELAPLDRPYPRLAELYARAGDPAHATALLDEMEREIEPAFLGRSRVDIDRARAEIALAEGSLDEAITLFRRADTGFCYICALPGLSIAYERAGQTDSAVATLGRYAESPYSDRFLAYTYPLGSALGPAHERLGALNEETGNLEEAARNYARFVELWAEADPELQPRVNAAQARLEAIMREIG